MISCPNCHRSDVYSRLARHPDGGDDWVHTCRVCGLTFPQAAEIPAQPPPAFTVPTLAELAAAWEPPASERSDDR